MVRLGCGHLLPFVLSWTYSVPIQDVTAMAGAAELHSVSVCAYVRTGSARASGVSRRCGGVVHRRAFGRRVRRRSSTMRGCAKPAAVSTRRSRRNGATGVLGGALVVWPGTLLRNSRGLMKLQRLFVD